MTCQKSAKSSTQLCWQKGLRRNGSKVSLPGRFFDHLII